MIKKLILFDWGNVIQNGVSKDNYNIDVARKNVCKEMNPKYSEKLIKMFDKNQFWTLNNDEYKEYINDSLKIAGSKYNYEDFEKSYLKFNEDVPYFKDTIDLIKELQKNEKCDIGLLSNISLLDARQLKEHLNLDNFNFLFLSYKLGVVKPNEEIYNIVEKVSKKDARNILFIDDKEDNIKAASYRNWNVCLASGNEFNKIKNACILFLDNKEEKLG